MTEQEKTFYQLEESIPVLRFERNGKKLNPC